jgi:hypothetical protein
MEPASVSAKSEMMAKVSAKMIMLLSYFTGYKGIRGSKKMPLKMGQLA